MKRTLAVLFVIALVAMSAFGYSLRMDSMGRIGIALNDFETDVERNPANIMGMDQPYFRLSLGMESGNDKMENNWDGVSDFSWYGSQTTEIEYKNMPITVLGFYKMGILAIGLQFDMPKETYSFNDDYVEYQHGTTEWDADGDIYELESAINNLTLTLGGKVGNFDVGVNFGQVKDTVTFHEGDTSDGDDIWEHDSWDTEYEVTADNTFYGFGVKYLTGKMGLEFAYKMASVTGEGKTTKDYYYDGDTNTATNYDVNDHDNYPIIKPTLDSSLIHLLAKYKYSDKMFLTGAVDVIAHSGEASLEFTTVPSFTPGDAEITWNNIQFGIGFEEENFKYGLEMNYNMVSGTINSYGILDPIVMSTYKANEQTVDATVLIWKAGAEYLPSDKLTLRIGAIKYAPLNITQENKSFDTVGTVTYSSDGTYGPFNTANIILSSIGCEYKINNQFSVEYGYIGGKYLYNQNTLTLISDIGLYGGSLAIGSNMLTPLSITLHKFSVKYSF